MCARATPRNASAGRCSASRRTSFITTPESLFLLLTSQGREVLRGVETLILDEVHALAGTKRGAHLALSLERLEALVDRPMQRIGLSATQRPLAEIGRFVAGTGREITLVDAGTRKELDLEVVVPVEDMRELQSTASLSVPVLADGVEMAPGVEVSSRSIWPSIYPALPSTSSPSCGRGSSGTAPRVSSAAARAPAAWR